MIDDNLSLPPEGLLRAAARLVERAAEKLDQRYDLCSYCGARRHRNQAHYHALQRLRGVTTQLNAAASDVESGETVKTDNKEQTDGKDHA